MADDYYRRDYPYRGRDGQSPNVEQRQASHYPPQPNDDAISGASRQPGPPQSIHLPPLNDPRGSYPPYPHQSQHHRPPMSSENSRQEGMYGPPPPQGNQPPPPPGAGPHLPPMRAPDMRSPTYPPGAPPPRDSRDDSFAHHRRPPFPGDPYYQFQGQQPQGHPPSQAGYPPSAGPPPPSGGGHNPQPGGLPQHHGYMPPGPPPNGYGREYGPPPPGYEHHPEYAAGAMGPQQPMAPQQTAPRQRTSIACKYCRKRKIRCSGFSQGGKCSNCIKMSQECIFQPVSSSASTAFVPVAALPGGVPPAGLQLYGAYGQPLPSGQHGEPPHSDHQSSAGPPPHHAGGPPPPLSHPGGGQVPAAHPHGPPPSYLPPPHGNAQTYYQSPAIQSPTEPPSPFGDPRSGDDRASLSSLSGRRRRRDSDDEGEDQRLPPPSRSGEDDTRRKSPLSAASSPGNQYPYPARREEGWNQSYAPQHQAGPSHLGYPQAGPGGPGSLPSNPFYDRRSPAASHESGESSPPRTISTGHTASSIMSLSNLIDTRPTNNSASDVDRTMLGRLDGRKRPKKE